MELTLTAKLLLRPTQEQSELLLETGRVFSKACNYVSGVVFVTHNLNGISLQREVYPTLRHEYGLPAQMACNAVRQVIGSYRTILENQGEWSKPEYKRATYTLSWNRDYSLSKDRLSVGTIRGRIKLPYESAGMEKYFDGEWKFGAAKVVNKHGKWYLHISMSKDYVQLENQCH